MRDLKLSLQESAVEMSRLDIEQSISDVDVYIEGLQTEVRRPAGGSVVRSHAPGYHREH